MTLRTRVSTLSLIAVGFGATAAMAEVSAADVWSNYDAYLTSVGGAISGDLSTSGAVTTIANAKVDFVLPFGFGNIAVAVSDITMTETDDGAVTITYPSPMTVAVSGNLQEVGAFAATIQSEQDAYVVTASGDAGDVTYTGTATNMTYTLRDITFDGSEDWTIDATGTIASFSYETRVTEGNLITAQSTQTMGDNAYSFNIVDPDGLKSTNTGSYGATDATMSLALPVGGSDIMNLSQAIREGLSVDIASRGTGSQGTATTTMNGQIMTDQDTTTGASEVTLRLSEDGLAVVGNVEDIAVAMTMAELMPFPIEAAIEQITANYALPVNASEAQQEFRYAFGLNGITVSEEIWGLFDPSGELPRDPATIALDLSGYGVTGLDLLDIPAMMSLSQSGDVPVQVDEVTLNSMTIAAAGAEVTAAGAFSLDNTDIATFQGFPRPEGALEMTLTGVNGLMDKLSALGFIPEEQLMTPRLMLGMFATPVGDDELRSTIEINGEGHVLANGQRLR